MDASPDAVTRPPASRSYWLCQLGGVGSLFDSAVLCRCFAHAPSLGATGHRDLGSQRDRPDIYPSPARVYPRSQLALVQSSKAGAANCGRESAPRSAARIDLSVCLGILAAELRVAHSTRWPRISSSSSVRSSVLCINGQTGRLCSHSGSQSTLSHCRSGGAGTPNCDSQS